MSVTLIVLSAGNSTRFDYNVKKQWIRINDKPLWQYVADRFNNFFPFKKTIITAAPDETELYKKLSNYEIIKGDAKRQLSLINALKKVNTPYVMITDVARACIPKNIVLNLIENIKYYDCAVPYLKSVDTVVYNDKTLEREKIKLIQTPQIHKSDILKKALDTDKIFTDERGAIEETGGSIKYIAGSKLSKKITYFDDLDLPCLTPPNKNIFVGHGYDTHKFEENKKMILGGVTIDVNYGLKAHSDGDVVIHSLIDALLGAAGYGDIGEFFPDTDEKYKNADSSKLLKYITDIIEKTGFEIINADISIVAEKPKLQNYKTKIQKNLSSMLNARVNVKATTNEKMGFIGRGEGISVLSSATLKYKDWYEDYHSRK